MWKCDTFFFFFMNSKLKTTAFIWNRNLLLYYECLLMSLLIILMPSWLKKAPKLLNVSVRLLSHCYMELYSIASWKKMNCTLLIFSFFPRIYCWEIRFILLNQFVQTESLWVHFYNKVLLFSFVSFFLKGCSLTTFSKG